MSHIQRDIQRYRERMRDAIRQRLPEVIANDDILTAPTGRRLRVPVRYLDEPRFRRPRQEDDGRAVIGDGDPGNEHGEFTEDIEFSLEEVAEMLFDELELPYLKPRVADNEDAEIRVEGITRRGPAARLHKQRTLYEWLKSGGPLHEDHLRYRDISIRYRDVSRAVVIFSRDASGSMDDDKRYRVRVAAFWTLLWLRHNYSHVQPVFIIHDTSAEEVDEHIFFHVGIGGGTLISSGLRLAEEILEQRYPAAAWNRYVLFFSDGENWWQDNDVMLAALRRLIDGCEMVAYGEVDNTDAHSVFAVDGVRQLWASGRLRGGPILDTKQVGDWLRTVFLREEEVGA